MNPVCIIGAGPAGLSAAVALERRGLPFRILDAGRRPGGIWDIEREGTPMYESAHFISSKTLSGFPDFPMPASYPDYPRHDQILEYIEAYARHHDLERRITFGATVTAARLRDEGRHEGGATDGVGVDRAATHRSTPDRSTPDRSATADGEGTSRVGVVGAPATWEVTWRDEGGMETTDPFSALIVATGVTWHPNMPEIPGTFRGEVRHSQSYRSPDEFRGRRVVIVGAGNSGVDIACDAARSADRAFLSLRRGYHFVPKYVFGTPSDVFAHGGPPLPAWLERRLFGFLLNRVLVGDLTRYGLPKPDHPILSSHPIMNTRVLHHLGHGDLTAKPDLTRLEGREVVFEDGSREEVDLVLMATGYRREFPFLDGAAPTDPDDLYLMLLHRTMPSLSFMGIFETDGAAYELFAEQAEVVAGTLDRLVRGGPTADAIRERIATDRPDLRGGRRYVDSRRHDFYVTDRHYRKALSAFGWALDRSK